MSADRREMRLQRYLALAGVASRRASEELITAGRVRVNGRLVTELGSKVRPREDRVTVDGRRVAPERHVWIILNKPPGVVCTTSDPEGRQTVLDLVPRQGVRLFPVGRLDYHTEGALLLTNDGDLAQALLHPRRQVPRVYNVKLRGLVPEERLAPIAAGVDIGEERPARAEVRVTGDTGKHTWVEMVLREGRNRQIHRMAEAVGQQVQRLVRVSFAGVSTRGLRLGEHRRLTQKEVDTLRETAGLSGERVDAPAAPPRQRRGFSGPRGRGPGGRGRGRR